MKYYKRSASVEAVTFDELVQHGIDNGANIVNGMPQSFRYQGHTISHENDNCYLVPCIIGASLKFNRGEMLVTCSDGQLFPMSLADFTINYERAPFPFPKPAAPPEKKCEHRKISYCHGSSVWVCATCDERFNADEFSRQSLERGEEGMTIAGDGASELGQLMREQRKGGPVPHA